MWVCVHVQAIGNIIITPFGITINITNRRLKIYTTHSMCTVQMVIANRKHFRCVSFANDPNFPKRNYIASWRGWYVSVGIGNLVCLCLRWHLKRLNTISGRLFAKYLNQLKFWMNSNILIIYFLCEGAFAIAFTHSHTGSSTSILPPQHNCELATDLIVGFDSANNRRSSPSPIRCSNIQPIRISNWAIVFHFDYSDYLASLHSNISSLPGFCFGSQSTITDLVFFLLLHAFSLTYPFIRCRPVCVCVHIPVARAFLHPMPCTQLCTLIAFLMPKNALLLWIVVSLAISNELASYRSYIRSENE